MNAEQFNARYPVGTPVFAYPGFRPEHPMAVGFQRRVRDGRTFGTTDPCKRLVTRTRTPAWTLGHGEPVVSVDGYPGGIVLEHVDVISEEEFAEARADETAAAVAAEGALPVPVGNESFASMDDRGVAEPSDAEEKRSRLFGFIEFGAEEEDLPSFAAALDEYLAAELAAVRAERDQAQARVAELEKRDAWLSALEAAGVDNWEGYDDALEAHEES